MLIDANIFLEVLLDQKKSEACKDLLRTIQTGKKKAFISSFTIDTIIIAMNRNKVSVKKIHIFLESLKKFRGLTLYNVNFSDRVLAVKFIKKYKLDYEDAITLQSALSSGSQEIVSFDKHFDKINEVKRVVP